MQDNPYQPPAATSASPIHSPLNHAAKKPAAPMVFGVIGFIFGGWGVLSFASMLAMFFVPFMAAMRVNLQMHNLELWVFIFITVMTTLLLFYASVGLVKYRQYGRQVFNVYAILSLAAIVLMQALSMVMGVAVFDAEMLIVDLVSDAIAAIYPALGLWLLNRTIVKNSLQ